GLPDQGLQPRSPRGAAAQRAHLRQVDGAVRRVLLWSQRRYFVGPDRHREVRGGLPQQARQIAAPGLRPPDESVRPRIRQAGRHYVSRHGGGLPREPRANLRAPRGQAVTRAQAAFGSAALAFSTMTWKAAGSMMVSSDITLRSTT